jgi:DNA polymerase III epsilon subunit-like protein
MLTVNSASIEANTIKSLFAIMKDKFRNFPKNYLVFDVETTGTVCGKDLITDIGHTLVTDGEVTDKNSVLLDWTRHERVDQSWLQERMLQTKRFVEITKDGRKSGKTYHGSYELLRNEGVPPEDALKAYRDMFESTRRDGLFFVAHNGISFDCPLLENHFVQYLDQPWEFADGEVFDSGMVCKATQIAMTVWHGESVREFSRRVAAHRMKGVFWNLENFAVQKYKLQEKYNLDASQAHTALHDSYVTHLLFKELTAQVAA